MPYVNDFRVGEKPVRKVYLGKNLVWQRILSNSNVKIPFKTNKDTIGTKLTRTKIYDKIQYNINTEDKVRIIPMRSINIDEKTQKIKFFNTVIMPFVYEVNLTSNKIKFKIQADSFLSSKKLLRNYSECKIFTKCNSFLNVSPQDAMQGYTDNFIDNNSGLFSVKALLSKSNIYEQININNKIRGNNSKILQQSPEFKIKLFLDSACQNHLFVKNTNAQSLLEFKSKNAIRRPYSNKMIPKEIKYKIITSSVLNSVIEQKNSGKTKLKFFTNEPIHSPNITLFKNSIKIIEHNLAKTKLYTSSKVNGFGKFNFYTNNNTSILTTPIISQGKTQNIFILNKSISRAQDVIGINSNNKINLQIKNLALMEQYNSLVSKDNTRHYTNTTNPLIRILPPIRNDLVVLTEERVKWEQGLVNGNTLEIRQAFKLNEYITNEKKILEVFNGE